MIPDFPRRRAALLCGLGFYLLWFVAAYGVMGLYSLPSTDGVQYLMPTVVARHPLDLTLPLIGNFQGFDQAWGLQCIGSLVLTKLLIWPLPWSWHLQIALSLFFLGLTAGTFAWLVYRITGGPWLAFVAEVLVLGNLTYLGVAFTERPELWCPALLMLLVATLGRVLAGDPLSRRSAALGFGCCMVLATLHPYAIGLTAGLLALSAGLQAIRRRPLRLLGLFALGYLLGLGCVALYFFTHPAAQAQFRENAALQMTFNISRLAFLHHPQQRLGAEWPWWIAGIATAAGITYRLLRGGYREAGPAAWMLVLCSALVGGVLVLDLALKTENFYHTSLAFPFAVALALSSAGALRNRLPIRTRCALTALLVLLLVCYLMWIPYRLKGWRAEGYVSIPRTFITFLDRLPPARMTYVTKSLWEAVLTRDLAKYRFVSFPLPLADASRFPYEEKIRAEMQPGDLLVVDVPPLWQDKFHSAPLMPIDPPDPATWDLIQRDTRIFQGRTPWGWDLRAYRMKEKP